MLVQLLSLLVALVVTRILWKRWKYDLHLMPSPPGLPLLGHALEFMYGEPSNNLASWLKRSLKKLGSPKIMRVDFMGTPWLFVCDNNFVKNVMFAKSSPFPRLLAGGGAILSRVGNDPESHSLLLTASPNAYVKATRKVYAAALQTHNLKIAIPKMNDVLQKMMKIIEAKRQEGPIEFQSLMVKLIIDVLGAVSFDENLGGLDGSREIYRLLMETGYVAKEKLTNPLKLLYVTLFPKSKVAKEEDALIAEMTAEWDRLTNEILEKEDPPENQQPFWHALRSMQDPDTKKTISYNLLRAEVGGTILAGSDTTGHQLAWLMALLAAHPRVVEKLLDQLKENGLYGPGARDVTFEDLGKLTYFGASIKEAMRLAYVGGGSLLRAVPEDMNILGYRVPKDTLIMAMSTRSCMTVEEWGDPDVFRPERWLGDEDMSSKYTLAFSFGPRDCVGQRMALLIMRLTIIKLITKYEITLKENIEDLLQNTKDGMVIEAKDGIWLTVKPRTLTT